MVFVVVALAFFVLAVGYATGTVQLATTHAGPSYKHAILAAVLGVGALVLASFSRRPTVRT